MQATMQLVGSKGNLPVSGSLAVASLEPTLFSVEESNQFQGRHIDPWRVKQFFRNLAEEIPFNKDIVASNVCGIGETMTSFVFGDMVLSISAMSMKGGAL